MMSKPSLQIDANSRGDKPSQISPKKYAPTIPKSSLKNHTIGNHYGNHSSSSRGLLSSPKHGTEHQSVKLNDRGGIFIPEDDIKSAFSMLDDEKVGYITVATLKKKFGVFFPELSLRDYKFLMNDQRHFTLDDMRSLLLENEVCNFDPIAEAFQCYDPASTGYLDKARLREIFKTFGYGDIKDDEFEMLVRIIDTDGDDKLSLDDFRALGDGRKRESQPKEEKHGRAKNVRHAKLHA